jgi:hypothetical protein
MPGPFWARIGSQLHGQCCGPRLGVDQQQRRSKMGCEITKADSKEPGKVIAKIKNSSTTLAQQNGWLKIDGWKKPSDNWYTQVEDGAMIDIETLHVSKPDHHFVVCFVGVPKVGKQPLRVNVGTLPFKKP